MIKKVQSAFYLLAAFLALSGLNETSPLTPNMNYSLTIATFNCRGLTKPPKQAEVIALALSKHIDVLVLQETYIHRAGQSRQFDSNFGTRSLWSFGGTGSRGVGIVLMPRFKGSIRRHSRDSDGRLLSIDLDCGTRIVNIYAPNSRPAQVQKDFFKSLDSYLVGPSRLVVVGDFNCVLNASDRVSTRGVARRRERGAGVQAFRELVNELELVDAWGLLRPGQSGMTWTGRGSQSRLDRFYVSRALTPRLHSTWKVASALSDHQLVALRLADNDFVPSSRGPWRLNPRLLEDSHVVRDVEHICAYSTANLDAERWDELKARVRNCLMEWGKRRAREERAAIQIVSDAILLLSSPISCGPGVAAALVELRREHRRLLRIRWDGLRALARAERWESETWCSRNILRRRLARSTPSLSSVIDPHSGAVVSTPDGVLDAARRFYVDLYRAEATTPELFPLERPQDPFSVADTAITEGELLEALKSCKRNRSPGSDGLTPEFYRKFWKQLAKPFTSLVNRLLSEGVLSASQREGLITLLCKDESRSSDLRAWRPITLLNCDYKLIAKCLSTRLTLALDSILGPYQACCVPGRSAQLHGFAIRDLLEWASSKNIAGLVCCFDQEKAFDVISHAYIFQTLANAGFSSGFVNMVRALYTEPNSAVIVHGRVSDKFSVQRGVRQGCPLSPVLYVLAIEPLLQRLASHPRIVSFPLPPGAPSAPIFAYADDLTIVVPDESSLCSALDVIGQYGRASGARLNTAKSSVMYLRGAPSQPKHGLPVASEVKILGFRFSPNGPSPSNWNSVLSKLQMKIRDFEALSCPVTARATIARSLLVTLLSYVASIMTVPVRAKLEAQRLVFRFIWGGKPDKVKRQIVQLPKRKGGLGLTDLGVLATALHVKWTRAALDSDMSLTSSFASYFLSTRLRLFAQSSFRNNIARAGTPSPFYHGAADALVALQAVVPNIDLYGTPLKDLAGLLTPSLPPHLSQFSLSHERPNWHLILADFLEPSRASFQWIYAHGNLPLYRRMFTPVGLMRRRASCLFCDEYETTDHVFHDCVIPQALLRKLAQLFDVPGIPYPTVRFLRPLPRTAVNQFVLLLVECTYQVWLARCAAVYSDRRPGLHEVLAKVRKEVWFHLRREQRRLGPQEFALTWCRPAVILEENGGSISITF